MLTLILILANVSTFSSIGYNETSSLRLSSIVGLVDNNGEVVCTGSVITLNHILSAAHCDEQDEVTSVTTLESNTIKRTSFFVNKKIMNPKYSIPSKWESNYETDKNNMQNDLLILELSKALPSYMTPVRIAGTSFFRHSFEFSGAGSGYDPSQYSSIKALVKQARIEQRKTWSSGTLRTQIVKKELNLRSRNIFVTSINKEFAMCKGDSGGAIYRTTGKYLTIYGIISRLDSTKKEREDLWFSRCSRHAIFSSTSTIKRFLDSLNIAY